MEHKEMDKVKRRIEDVIKLFHLFYKNREIVRKDLEDSGEPIILALHNIVKEIGENTLGEHQRRSFVEVMEIALWIYFKDNAYTQQGHYFLHKLFEAYDEGKFDRLPYPKPDMWRVNRVTARNTLLSVRGLQELPSNRLEKVAISDDDNVLTERIKVLEVELDEQRLEKHDLIRKVREMQEKCVCH